MQVNALLGVSYLDVTGLTIDGLAQVAADAGLRDRFTLYGLAGDALRGSSTPDDGFSRRIFERMRREAVAIEPGFDPLAEQ